MLLSLLSLEEGDVTDGEAVIIDAKELKPLPEHAWQIGLVIFAVGLHAHVPCNVS